MLNDIVVMARIERMESIFNQKMDSLSADIHAFWSSMNKTLETTTEALVKRGNLGSSTDDKLISELRTRSFLEGSVEKINKDLGIVNRGPVTDDECLKAVKDYVENDLDYIPSMRAALESFAKSRGLI